MIRRPGPVADRSFVRPADRPSGPDLDVADHNAAAWGADLPVYRTLLTRALASSHADLDVADGAGGVSGAATSRSARDLREVPDVRVVRGLAAVAAWRAGVVELREDVLARLPGLPPAAAAAALGTRSELLPAFLAAQAADPFARPGPVPAGTVLHRVGGFAGLGGPWLAPPVAADTAGPGRFTVSTEDGAQWTVVADAWGARLRPGPAAPGPATGARAVVSPGSYLVEVLAG